MVRSGLLLKPVTTILPMTDDTVRQDPNLRNPIHLLAFGLGSGVSPFAPGTMGTLVAVPIYLMIDPLPLFSYGGTSMITTMIGVGLILNVSMRRFTF